ncbi:MAG: ABC transporter permease [bacterium]|nr:ABC transporter permease [bacterium]
MNIRESVQLGLRGVMSHKLRSLLTMLGVIFGVAAVIAMVSIGEGARQETIRQIELMGTSNIMVKKVDLEGPEKERAKQLSPEGLTLADAKYLAGLSNLMVYSIPVKEVSSKARLGRKFPKSRVVGTSPEYPLLTNYPVKQGRFLNHADIVEERKVAVLGAEVAKQFFPLENPLQKEIKISNSWYTIIGVMQDRRISQSVAAASLRDVNKDIYIPISTALTRFGGSKGLNEINIQVTDSEHIKEVANLIHVALFRRHNGIGDYDLVIPEELLKQSQRTQRIFNIVMGAIAGISLLVGGIGIMNIMLATVTQRTREIGIRRAVGASKRDILGQFLIECLIISIIGGLIGVLLGVGLGWTITFYAQWTTIVSMKAIIMAFGISAGIGIIFGMYPARKAAELDPIDALRYE